MCSLLNPCTNGMPVLTLDVTKRFITESATISVNWNGVQPTMGGGLALSPHPARAVGLVNSLLTAVVPDSTGNVSIANLEGCLNAIGCVAMSLELDMIYFVSREKVAQAVEVDGLGPLNSLAAKDFRQSSHFEIVTPPMRVHKISWAIQWLTSC
jgi:hypothetical protein